MKKNAVRSNNKNRNTWANKEKSSSPTRNSDGTVDVSKQNYINPIISQQLREGAILRAARSSFALGIDEAKNNVNFINEEVLEQHIMSEKVQQKIQVACNFLRCLKVFNYHLFYPFSTPIVYFIEGKSTADLFKFWPCHCNSISPLSIGNAIHVSVTIMSLLYLIMMFADSDNDPCSYLLNLTIGISLSLHFTRLFMIALKYALIPKHEYEMLVTFDNSITKNMWSGWHLAFWGMLMPKDSVVLDEELQLAILREGIVAPRQKQDNNNNINILKNKEEQVVDSSNRRKNNIGINNMKDDGFLFQIHAEFQEAYLHANKKIKDFIIKSTRNKHNHVPAKVISSTCKSTKSIVQPISDFKIKELPSAVEEKIESVYTYLRARDMQNKQDYSNFRNTVYYQIETITKNNIGPKSYVVWILVDGREITKMCFQKASFPINLYTFQKLALFIAIMLALCPWIIAIVESNEGLFSSKINTKKPVYPMSNLYCVNNGNERITTIFNSTTIYNNKLNASSTPETPVLLSTCPCNYHNLSVYDQIQYSMVTKDYIDRHDGTIMMGSMSMVWMMIPVTLAATATLTQIVLIATAINWLYASIFIYKRQYISMKTLDDLISRRWYIVKERTKSGHPGKIESNEMLDGNVNVDKYNLEADYTETSLHAKALLPVLMLSTPSNIRSYISSRKILKKIGLTYYYRAQIYATLLILVEVGLTVLAYAAELNREKHQLIGTSVGFFIMIAVGVMSMIHYGAESNDQVTRGIQHLYRQRMLLVENYERKEDLGIDSCIFKNYQQIQAISIALNAAAKLLEEEWTRQPILIFGLRAGRAVYGLIASLIVSAMSSIGSSYIGRKATP